MDCSARSYNYQNSVFLLKGTSANLESLLLKRKCTQSSIEFSTTKIPASESSRIFEIISVRLMSLPPDSENNSDNDNDDDNDDDDDDDEFDNSDGNNIFIC